MDDMIARAAAIEYLMTNMGWRDEDGYEVDDADEKRAIITDLVNGIPAVDAVPVVQQWISVKDRLPVNLGTVIVANKAGVSFAYFNGAYWERGAATKHKPIKTITHWMPLPEPPKMDGDANG